MELLVLTRMLSFPSNSKETFSMSCTLCSLDDTSHTQPFTWRPLSVHFFKHSLRIDSFLEHVYTFAPSSQNSSTIACLKKTCISIRFLLFVSVLNWLFNVQWRNWRLSRLRPHVLCPRSKVILFLKLRIHFIIIFLAYNIMMIIILRLLSWRPNVIFDMINYINVH